MAKNLKKIDGPNLFWLSARLWQNFEKMRKNGRYSSFPLPRHKNNFFHIFSGVSISKSLEIQPLNYFLPPNTYNQIQIQYVPYQFSIGPSHFKVWGIDAQSIPQKFVFFLRRIKMGNVVILHVTWGTYFVIGCPMGRLNGRNYIYINLKIYDH